MPITSRRPEAILLAIILAFTAPLAAAVPTRIWLRAPHASPQEFTAHVSTEPNSQSFVDYYLQKLALDRKRQRLSRRYAQAQKAYLQARPEAGELFTKVVDLGDQADWSPVERKTIQLAYLRLAQLAENRETAEWLRKAAEFAPDIIPDAKLIPPPLIKTYNELRRSLKMADFSQLAWRDHFEIVLVNGRRIEASDSFELPLNERELRVHLISNSFRPVLVQISSKDLMNWHPPFESMVIPASGTDFECAALAEPNLSELRFIVDRLAVFNDDNCTFSHLPLTKATALGSAGETTRNDKEPEEHVSLRLPEKPTEARGALRNKWLWIGAAVLAAGAVALSQQREERSSSAPTRKEDF